MVAVCFSENRLFSLEPNEEGFFVETSYFSIKSLLIKVNITYIELALRIYDLNKCSE